MLWDAIAKRANDPTHSRRLAIISDEASLTYVELAERVETLAHALREVGVREGHAMLAQLDNVPAFLVALLASARVRATFAPIDIGATDAEIEGIAELTRSDLIIGAASEAARSERLFRNVVSLDAAGSVMSVRAPSLSAPSIAPNIGCMQFSSGTTGASKGILLSHEAFFYRSHYLMRSLGLTDADRTLCALPLSHPHGSECLALPTLMAGGSLYVKSPKFSFPLYILEELAKHRITFFSSIPQFYDFAVKLGLGTPPDLSALRLPFCGSAALSQVTAENFRTKYGVHIRQGYGLAELAVICINHHDTGNIVYDSVGKPIEGIEWQLVGGDSESEGELVVRSKAMFSGYINDEEATRAKLRDGWLYTGDVVSIDADGRFRIVGRKEDFIKVNGFKVYAAEVEKAIVGLPWIKECAVVSEKDALGTERIVAHIVPTDSTRSSEEMHALLIRDLRMTLSEHKLPKRCVAWPELPKNPLGKILKSQIAAVSTTK